MFSFVFFFFQAEDGIRDWSVTEFRRVLFRSVQRGLLRPGRLCIAVFASSSPGPPLVARRRKPALNASARGALSRLPKRSEERRVGKKCRYRCSAWRDKKKK